MDAASLDRLVAHGVGPRTLEARAIWEQALAALAAAVDSKGGPSPLDTLVSLLVLRARTNDRDEVLRALAHRARVRCRLAPMLGRLGRRGMPIARLLVDTLDEPLEAPCRPECCSASDVRAAQIRARLAVLQIVRRIAPDAVRAVRPDVVRGLVSPPSRKIALATMELVAASAEGVRQHRESVVEALEHPHPLIVVAALGGLRRLDGTDARRAYPAILRALRHDDPRARRAAIRTVVALRAAAKEAEEARAVERLERLGAKDANDAVRNAARRALALLAPEARRTPG